MLILLHGDNAFASLQKLHTYTAKQKEVQIIHGDEVRELNDIFISLDNLSLFSDAPAEMTVVKRFDKNKRKSLHEDFADYLKDHKLDSQKLIFWEEGSVDKRRKFYKMLKKHGEVEEYKALDDTQLLKWIKSTASKHGFELDSQLADKIITRIGTDQLLLLQEIRKLSLYLKSENRDKFSAEDLQLVSDFNREGDVWELMDAISARDKTKILKLLSENLRSDNDAPPLIGAIANQLKMIYLLQDKSISTDLITSELKIHPYPLKKASYNVHRFPPQFIKVLYSKLASLDFAIKTGKIDATLGLNLLLASI